MTGAGEDWCMAMVYGNEKVTFSNLIQWGPVVNASTLSEINKGNIASSTGGQEGVKCLLSWMQSSCY